MNKKRCWYVVLWGLDRELRGLLYSSPVLLLSIKNKKLAQAREMIFQPGFSTWSQFLSRVSVALKPQGTFVWGSLVDLHKPVHCYKSKSQTVCWFTLGCCLQESDSFLCSEIISEKWVFENSSFVSMNEEDKSITHLHF